MDSTFPLWYYWYSHTSLIQLKFQPSGIASFRPCFGIAFPVDLYRCPNLFPLISSFLRIKSEINSFCIRLLGSNSNISQNYKMGEISKRVANTLLSAKRNIQKSMLQLFYKIKILYFKGIVEPFKFGSMIRLIWSGIITRGPASFSFILMIKFHLRSINHLQQLKVFWDGFA